jgi:diaminohydroxyphosphoribosylaminopyrimidine deaminase/5-amino-6-(5-phosphoribosylamino)uracil reductase
MRRCLELAKLGCGNVAPNPMVGAVLVYDDRIIGEGYHQRYGEAHAEVNCIDSVAAADIKLISWSTLYVSLEPCAHFGKTPPCADLIIQQKIPKVIIGCRDPFIEVDGKGIEKLKAAGVHTETGILEEECKKLNRRFFTFHIRQRPYIILKWAQTADEFIAGTEYAPGEGSLNESTKRNDRLHISNEYSNRLVHKWRSEEAAILIGTNTALLDDPELTTRVWPGHSPVRLILDMDLRLPAFLKIFDRSVRTIVFNSVKQEEDNGLFYHRLVRNAGIVEQIMNALYHLNIQSVLVEGGAKLLQAFIDEGKWDEARVIINQQLNLRDNQNAPIGLRAPKSDDMVLQEEIMLGADTIKKFFPLGVEHADPSR